MITLGELLMGRMTFEQLTPEQQKNVMTLLHKVNSVRSLYGKPMIITSCVRTKEDQIRVYKAKGITDLSKIPMKSKHLFGAACDVADPGLVLTKWLKANPHILEELDLYCEEGNSNWVHFQIEPFGSYKRGGTRWFRP